MTGPVTTEALVEGLARDLAKEGGWQDPDAPWTDNQGVIARGGAGEPVWRDFVDDARSLLGRETFTTLLAALQRVTAERDAYALVLSDCAAALAQVPLGQLPGCVDMMVVSALDAPPPSGERSEVIAAADRITARFAAERDEARADQKEAEDSNDALNVKLHALAPHGSCACSYDKPGDVCLHHSPALAIANAELARLRERLEIAHAYDGAVNKIPFPEGMEHLDGIECRDETIRNLEEQIDRIRAEGEALVGVLKQIDGAGLRIRLTHELGDAVRTALARAATAGEGRSDG